MTKYYLKQFSIWRIFKKIQGEVISYSVLQLALKQQIYYLQGQNSKEYFEKCISFHSCSVTPKVLYILFMYYRDNG